MKKNLSFRYSLQQASYWMGSCGVTTYAATFLLEKGFDDYQVGVVLFLGLFFSFLLQPVVASIADNAKRNIIPVCIAVLAVLSVSCFTVIWLTNIPVLIFELLYIAGITFYDMQQSLLNAESVYYTSRGWNINYGLGRSFGALGYSISAKTLGFIMSKYGVQIMLPVSIAFMIMHIVISISYPRDNSKVLTNKVETCSLPVFFAKYKWYTFSMLGIMLFAAVHIMMENYLIVIVEPLGGNSSNVGTALLFAGLPEIIALVLYSRTRDKIGTKNLLILSGFFFTIKALMFLYAKSLGVIYAGQVLQIVTYVFLSPTQLYYAQECIMQCDMVKGQGISTASYAMGSALGNLAGGILISARGIKAMLITSIACAACGTVVMLASVPTALKKGYLNSKMQTSE